MNREEMREIAKQAVTDMPFDWYCPWDSTRMRRDCADCVAFVVADAIYERGTHRTATHDDEGMGR